LASLLSSGAKRSSPSFEPGFQQQLPAAKDDFAWERDPLLRVMQCLYCASSASDAEVDLRLSPFTADEEALRNLSHRTRDFVPALTAFRKKAVDRGLLMARERREQGKDHQDDGAEDTPGQSSDVDFGISDASGNEMKETKEPPLILPVGWHTETCSLNGRARRMFIDARGRKYPTMAAARIAINAERTRQNLAAQIRKSPAWKVKEEEPHTGQDQVHSVQEACHEALFARREAETCRDKFEVGSTSKRQRLETAS